MKLDTTKLQPHQITVVRELIKQFKGAMLLTRKQLQEGYTAIKGEGSSTPYFISKNAAAKAVDQPHRYDLHVLLPENQTKQGNPKKRLTGKIAEAAMAAST